MRKMVWVLAVLVVVFAVSACGSAEPSSTGGGKEKEEDSAKQMASEKTTMSGEARKKQVAPKKGTVETGEVRESKADVPKRRMLRLTVPAMERVKNDKIPTTLGTDEARLRTHAAIHLLGTGFPWEEEANVYIAGHRLGYKGTESYLAFYDINKLKEGDKIYITDAKGNKYTYEVFRKMIVDPLQVEAIQPIEGKNIVSLQACTLPDYSRRIIVQGELQKS